MNRRHFITASSAALAASSLPACKPKGSSTESGEKKKLTVFTWADYLSEDAKAGFEKANHCTIVIDTFDPRDSSLVVIASR